MNEDRKIIFLGLDNAGKTSLLTRLGGKLSIEDLTKLEPTRGVERQEISSKSMSLLIWDFGGQSDHRSEYLQDPEEYFLDTTLLIYVIDIQEPDRFQESVDYFKNILDILDRFDEDPDILIFFHKFDPDIKNDIKIFNNIQKLKTLLESIINGTKFNYEGYLTSIYSGFPQQPRFIKLVKEIVEGKPLEQATLQVKVNKIGQALENTLSAIVKISSNIMTLEKRFSSLEQKLINNKILSKDETLTEATKQGVSKEKSGKLDRDVLKTETISQLKDIIVEKEKE